ncbi:single-stranded DNA-binding protein [Naumannella sp. ID2617S]|nr:single-stranded DNA-binding protein [Enemella dayhoffiae]NNG20327.1 single-stranded DNA-binding protein [Naumannella sp. ID2617S]
MEPIVSMTGRLGTPVDERTTRNGTPYATFRMASTTRFRREGVWVDGPTTWVSVRCYRGLAEHVQFSLQKGQPVLVIGRLRTESWQDQSGAQRERTVLEAQSVGHDLNWGASSFRRLVKEQPPAERDDEDVRPEPDQSGEFIGEEAERVNQAERVEQAA